MVMKCVSFLVFGLILLRVGTADKSGEQRAFERHDANHDRCLEQAEFEKIFWDMDTHPADRQITINEVREGWHHFHFHDYRDSAFFFMEIDRDRDLFITKSDLDFLFQTFDTSNNGCLTLSEYSTAWNSLFNE